MTRPHKCRLIHGTPSVLYFKPRAISLCELEEVRLNLDEYEALRLADLDNLYQEEAAQQMQVSRATFGNILNRAHRKVADAIVNGKALRIEGGVYAVKTERGQMRLRKGSRYKANY